MLVTKAAIKQPQVMMLETSKEWDRRKERRVKPIRESVKVELEGLEKTTMVGPKLTGIAVVRITELLKKNRCKFA